MAERGQDYILQGSSTDSGHTDVGKLTSVTLSRGRDTIETNNFDSPDDAESLAGMKEWSISAEALYVYDDAGQAVVEAAFAQSSSAYYWKLTSADDTAGVFEFSGQAWVTSLEIEASTNEVVTYSIELTGTGELTRSEIST